MSMIDWWRNRNLRWAQAHLTVKKYDRIQKNAARIARLGPLRYFLLAIVGGTAYMMILSAIFGYCFGTVQLLHRQPDPGFLTDLILITLKFSLFISIVFSVFYYFLLKEWAKIPPPQELSTAGE